MRKFWHQFGLLFTIAQVIVILDQLTKSYIRNNLGFGEIWSPWPWLTPYARIVNWNNTGVAFGLFQGMNEVFKVLALIVALVIVYYFPRVPREDWPLRIAMGMQLGGALGNLIDRLVYDSVTDFISLGDFPVFNVADSSITVGVIVLLIGVWLQDKKGRKRGISPSHYSTENNPDDVV